MGSKHTDAAQKRGHGAQRNLPVRRLKACKRVLHDFLLALLRSGDGLPAILQHCWATTGPTLAVFRCAGEIHPQILAGEQPVSFGDGKQSRDFTYVENAVHANLLACKAPAKDVAGKVFNVASGRRVYLNDLYRILQELTGYSAQAKYGPERRGDVKDSLADRSRVEKYLGYRPTVSPEEGLRRIAEWYRSAGSEAAKRSALSFASR